jgi:hypothetical protein
MVLATAELVLQVGAGPSLAAGHVLDAYRLLPGHHYGGGLCGNNLGYPGPDFQRNKPANVFRIAALGNSFAIGHAVPFADNYLSRLGRELPGCEVYNFGVSGAGPREYRIILESDVWQFQPDLVLVSLFAGCNITEIMPSPRYLDPRRHALYVVLDRGWQWLRETLRQVPTDPLRDGGPWPPPGLSWEAFRGVEARRLGICVRPTPPPVEKKWRRTFADLDKLIAACHRNQTPLAVVLIPDEFQVNPAVLDAAVKDARLAPAALDLALPQRRLAANFAARGVPCLDLLPVFQRHPHTYVPRDTHWNVAGHRLAAREIVEWLKPLVTR